MPTTTVPGEPQRDTSLLTGPRGSYRYGKDDLPAVVNNSCAIVRAGRESDYIVSWTAIPVQLAVVIPINCKQRFPVVF